jgi:hypothetical protein
MLFAAMVSLQSCSGNKAKKGAETRNPAPAVEEQKRGGGQTANPASSPVSEPAAAVTAKKRTPAELLAAIPCKLENKKGIFAVFPDNPAAGQGCFGLYPAGGNNPDIPKFDIQGGGMHIMIHDTARGESGGMKLMRWEERNGKPCLETACGKEIPFKLESYSAPGESGWSYVILTPEKSVDFVSTAGGYIGLVIGADKYIPLFR